MMMLLILTMLFICSSQPMVMVMSMILMTLFYSVMVYYVMGSYWYSYAFLLVMLTAVMVLFTYMASFMNEMNESFEYMGMVLLSVVIYLYLYKGYWDQEEFLVIGDEMSLKLYKSLMFVFNLFLVSMLLAMMVLLVWISGMVGVAVRGF